MEFRVFYSYQSDSPKHLNEYFIKEAIEKAKQNIKEVQIKIVKGFSGTSGQKPLAQTMFEQSRSSDIFIGDVTFTSAKVWHLPIDKCQDDKSTLIEIPNDNHKPSPNPNVLIETGYSWCHKDFDRTILVMNTAYGSPKELPADFGDLRWPIEYFLNDEIYNEEESKEKVFKSLVEQLTGAIKSTIKTTRAYQAKQFLPLKQHDNWSSSDFKSDYIVTDDLTEIIQKLRYNLLETSEPQRLIGLPQSGKTRLAWQFLRKINSSIKRHEALERIFYYPDGSEYQTIAKKILELKELNQDHIVILDNCSFKQHKRLCGDLDSSNVKVLTIDNIKGNEDDDAATIKIPDHHSDSLVLKAITSKYEGDLATKLIAKSQGVISKALSFVTTQVSEKDIDNEEVLYKLMLGDYHDDKEVNKILEYLSLFSNIGYNDRFSYQSDYIRSFVPHLTIGKYYTFIEKLTDTNIIQIAGDYVRINSFIKELYENVLPRLKELHFDSLIRSIAKNNLSKQFTDRLYELIESDTAKYILDEITKEGSALFDYNFIDSEQGSQLLYGLVELVPDKILVITNKIISLKSRDELLDFRKGRRNLILTLDYLVSKEEYFNDAAKLLYQLAEAENENFSNNATGQFTILFQPRLSGTSANYDSRMKLLKELHVDGQEPSNVLLKSSDRALTTRSYVGFGRSTRNEEETFSNYEPKTPEELQSYWSEIIKFLIDLDSEKANEILTSNLYAQVTDGNAEEIWKAISSIIEKHGEISVSLRQTFEYLKADNSISEDMQGKIKALIDKYSGESIKDKLKYIVALPPRSVSYEDGTRIDHSQNEALKLANDLFVDGQYTWLDNADVLLKGEQRQTYEFGIECAKLLPKDHEFIDAIINKLKLISSKEQNNNLIAGYLFACNNEEFTRSVIDKYISIPEINLHALHLIGLLEIQLADLEKLYPIVEANPIFATKLQFIKLEHLSEEEVITFLKWLKEIDSYGSWSCVVILGFDLVKRKMWSENMQLLAAELLKHKGLIKGEGIDGWGSFMYYTDALNYLSKYGLTHELIRFVCNEIIDTTFEFSIVNESEIHDILDIMLGSYWKEAWPIFSMTIQNTEYSGWYKLKGMLEKCRNITDENLLKWMVDNPLDGPQYVIQFIEFEKQVDDKWVWTELAKEMITRFSNNEKFLSYLSNRLHSYMCSGSAVSIHERRKSLIEQFANSGSESLKDFTKRQVEYFDSAIEGAKREDENMNLRY